ncbi:hypothetical protein KC353_g1097 [Hortaea werneckii]|nr:hypothetical protein KC353_g1097 [Hortaea werneckii]
MWRFRPQLLPFLPVLAHAAPKSTQTSYTPTTSSYDPSTTASVTPAATLEGCYKVIETVAESNTILDAGPQSYCQCDDGILAAINTVKEGDTTYEVCAGAPMPTVDRKPTPTPSFDTTEVPEDDEHEFFDLSSIESCANNTWLPTEECMRDIEEHVSTLSTNKLYFGSGCNKKQQKRLKAGAFQANRILQNASDFPYDDSYPGPSMMRYWFGEDYEKYENRIHDIVKRARNWYGSSSNNIWMHCGDPYKWCKLKPNDPRKGKENLQHIGGYAWTDFGWFWNNQHVAAGVDIYIYYASDMAWLKTLGSLFLHEMFHLDFVDKAGGKKSKDHVKDCFTKESWKASKRGKYLAYGPKYVFKLAHNVGKGGGAYWSSRNADSYALALNAVFWYQKTGVLPEAEGERYFAAEWEDEGTMNRTDAPLPPIMVQLGNMTGNNDFPGAAESALVSWEDWGT